MKSFAVICGDHSQQSYWYAQILHVNVASAIVPETMELAYCGKLFTMPTSLILDFINVYD